MAHSIQRHFADLSDPQRAQGERHQLSDMIVLAVCAVICAADSWADVADFGRAKAWFAFQSGQRDLALGELDLARSDPRRQAPEIKDELDQTQAFFRSHQGISRLHLHQG